MPWNKGKMRLFVHAGEQRREKEIETPECDEDEKYHNRNINLKQWDYARGETHSRQEKEIHSCNVHCDRDFPIKDDDNGEAERQKCEIDHHESIYLIEIEE